MELYIYIYIYKIDDDQVTLWIIPGVNFDKSTVGLHYIHILSMLTKFHGDKKLIAILSINCLSSSVYS